MWCAVVCFADGVDTGLTHSACMGTKDDTMYECRMYVCVCVFVRR